MDATISPSHMRLTPSDTVRQHRGIYDAVDTDFIADILNMPWFRHTWTVQEVALAQSATLVCGNTTLDWKVFTDALRWLQRSQNNHVADPDNMIRPSLSNPGTFFDDIRTHSKISELVNTPCKDAVS